MRKSKKTAVDLRQLLSQICIVLGLLISVTCKAYEVPNVLLGRYSTDFELLTSFASDVEKTKIRRDLEAATIQEQKFNTHKVECPQNNKCFLTIGLFSDTNSMDLSKFSVLKMEPTPHQLTKVLQAAKQADYKPLTYEDLRIFKQFSLQNCFYSRSESWRQGICNFAATGGATYFGAAFPDMSSGEAGCSGDVCLIPVEKIN
jgi:hypothetical protein